MEKNDECFSVSMSVLNIQFTTLMKDSRFDGNMAKDSLRCYEAAKVAGEKFFLFLFFLHFGRPF